MVTTSNLICDCNEDSRSACGGEQITTSEGGEARRYCVLHFRSANKGEAFEKALLDKIERGDFNFNGVWFPREVNFSGQHFGDEADFRGATFNGRVNCYEAVFAGKALFHNATFHGEANFHTAHFRGEAYFAEAQFKTDAHFIRAEFGAEAGFYKTHFQRGRFDFATFEKRVTFYGSIFEEADLSHITFNGEAEFSGAAFNSDVPFNDTKFTQPANFSSVTFKGDVNFLFAAFGNSSDFSGAAFNAKVKFTGLTFKGAAIFRKTVFEGDVDFSRASFNGAKFKYSVFNNKADFQGATFNTCSSKYYVEQADFSRVEFRGEADFAEVKFKKRVLTEEEEAKAAKRASLSPHTWRGLDEKERVVTADFARTRFYGEADFASATFEVAADFHRAIFSGYADFSPHNTDDDDKQRTVFDDDADFNEAAFHAEANFSEVDFRRSKVTFIRATFKDYVRFSGGDRKKLLAQSFDFRHAMVDKPERISFHSVGMHPCWLVDVDVRKFDFTNVKWHVKGFKEMITYLTEMSVNEPSRLLEKLCQRLSINHEENQHYRWASRWRYWAMEARRRERFYGLPPVWSLHWWYWLASGYGERSVRALVGLGIIWLSFAFVYVHVGFVQPPPPQPTPQEAAAAARDTVGKPLEPGRALTYSLGVMTLQKPEPRPLTVWAQTLVTVETIIGPLQAALLALAVRRRFMR